MPNRVVDVNSWTRSACYPRRTFYPMSDGPSMRNHRITNTNFRSCSRCLSHSQAPLCLCTQRLVSNQPEGTFARLRYSFGGDRPSQTAHLPLSQSFAPWLVARNMKGGIPPTAQCIPKDTLHRLPPILCIISQTTMASYSKASRGLSVQP